MDCFSSGDSRTFCASEVTEKTLYNIYRSAKDIEKLLLIDCGIRKLPENLFLYLPKLKVVDLRDNFLVSLPPSLAYHPTVEVLLLAGNLFLHTPSLLRTLPSLVKHDLLTKTLPLEKYSTETSTVSEPQLIPCHGKQFI